MRHPFAFRYGTDGTINGPGTENYGNDRSTFSAGQESEYHGMMPELLRNVAERAGFTVEYQLLSPASINYSRSLGMGTWDACVIDVERGILDICAMHVYETASRRSSDFLSFLSTPFLSKNT